ERILDCRTKVARRDLPVAAALGTTGVTTVSAALTLAAAADIEVFATGGIGGVHRSAGGAPQDVSADLRALADHPVITVSAGAKVLLDLAATLERLETLSVPVLGLGTDDFPAFHATSSGLAVPQRIEEPAQAAAVLRERQELGDPGGVLLAVPVSAAHALPLEDLEAAVTAANRAAQEEDVRGAELTPFVLERLADELGSAAVDANIALATNNARVAAAVAVALARS
ncbi:MAG: pseudouridine-5'-phosphate glycosidase, partial [Nitriliruptorales bacterium]|nr:pseudouridine-5'-phosphate glycosidase [Nitriliruptorales bacterium]